MYAAQLAIAKNGEVMKVRARCADEHEQDHLVTNSAPAKSRSTKRIPPAGDIGTNAERRDMNEADVHSDDCDRSEDRVHAEAKPQSEVELGLVCLTAVFAVSSRPVAAV
jgi:hypothetical protein